MKQKILMVDRIPHPHWNGVARYMHALATHAALTATKLDIRMLQWGREQSLAQWAKYFSPSADTPLWATRLNRRILLPFSLYRTQAALIHFPYHNLPTQWLAGHKPIVLSLHGAAALAESEWGLPTARGERIRQHLYAGQERICHYITVSEWAKQEIITKFGLPSAQITTIYHGVDHTLFQPLPAKTVRAFLQKQYTLTTPYLLHVGPCSPRKNVTTLVRAFARLKKRYHIPHMLVLAGRHDIQRTQIETLAQQLGVGRHLLMTGAVTDQALSYLYNGADIFIFPSHYEGFGLPILEAMACHTPVITSNITAMPEVAADAAVLINNPQNAVMLATTIIELLQNKGWYTQLQQKGLARAKQFTWQESAQQHLQLFHRLLS